MSDTEDQMPELLPWDDEYLARRGNYLVLITPEVAKRLLDHNTNNRRPRPRKIEQFKRDMLNGRWDPDASDVKFARPYPYELLDGQNRFMACVDAGVPFPTLVRTGLNPVSKTKVDTGTARTNADVLKMEGIAGPQTGIAAAMNLRVRFMERYELFNRTRGLDFKALTLTHDEMLAYLDEHPMMLKFAGRADHLRIRVAPAIPTSAWLAALSWFAEINESMTADMAERLINGEFGGTGDPLQALIAYAARQRARQTGSPGARGRMAQEEHLMALIKVWNYLRSGVELKRLAVNRTEKLELPR